MKLKYQEERWLLRANGSHYSFPVTTPEEVLKSFLHAYGKTAFIDTWRMNRKQYFNSLQSLLSDDVIRILNSENDAAISREIVGLGIGLLRILTPSSQRAFLVRLKKIHSPETAHKLILEEEKQIRSRIWWERLKWLVIPALAILLCLLIWMAGAGR